MHPYHQTGIPLTQANATRLRVFLAKHGTPKACELLGVGVVSIDKLLGGGSATPKTVARVVAALDAAA